MKVSGNKIVDKVQENINFYLLVRYTKEILQKINFKEKDY